MIREVHEESALLEALHCACEWRTGPDALAEGLFRVPAAAQPGE
ncbi:hypothetical protein ACFUIT_01620 [Streptomyces sp. NPDC057239]